MSKFYDPPMNREPEAKAKSIYVVSTTGAHFWVSGEVLGWIDNVPSVAGLYVVEHVNHVEFEQTRWTPYSLVEVGVVPTSADLERAELTFDSCVADPEIWARKTPGVEKKRCMVWAIAHALAQYRVEHQEVIDGYRERVRQLDVAMNGDRAAAQPSFVDIWDQLLQRIRTTASWPRVVHPSLWRHRKRGTYYDVLTATATAQCSTGPINEGDHVTVYQGHNGGDWHVRKTEEFQDGRFERL